MRHGTRYAYFTYGCRCDDCIEGRRENDRQRRQRRMDRAAANPSIIRHGKNGYADYGCRCSICMDTRRNYNRARLGQEPAKTWTEDEIASVLDVYATQGLRSAARLDIASTSTIQKWAKERGVRCFEPPIVHGRARYQRYGCRCEVCVAAYRSDIARLRADRQTRLDEAPHGTSTAYVNWGCRCEPCKDAGSLNNQRQAIRRKAGLTRPVGTPTG
jgi:hypothetical protein